MKEYTHENVRLILDEFSNKLGDQYLLDADKVKKLEVGCSIIDGFIDEFFCESANVEVDDKSMDVIVTLICPDMTLENGTSHPFFRAIQYTSAFAFSQYCEDFLRVSFIFSDIWRRKNNE